MIKTILVDLDDTLWATQLNNKEALRELYHHYGWERAYASFELMYQRYAPHNEWLWQEYRHGRITKHQLNISRFEHILQPMQSAEGHKEGEQNGDTMDGDGKIYTEADILEINAHFLERTAVKSGVIEGAHALLEELRELYTIVLVSNGFKEVQQRKMDSARLTHLIDYIVLSEDLGVSKPKKAIFDYALSLSRTRRSEAIFLGDSWDADIMGCQNAGLPAIWFNPTHAEHPTPLAQLRYPVYEVAHLAEVPAVIRQVQMNVLWNV